MGGVRAFETQSKTSIMSPEIIVPLGFFAVSFGIMYLIVTSRNRERLAMIEKGIDPRVFTEARRYTAIRVGLMAVGVSVGLVLANILVETTALDQDVMYPALSFLFGGLGLIISHFITRKMRLQDEEEERKKG